MYGGRQGVKIRRALDIDDNCLRLQVIYCHLG